MRRLYFDANLGHFLTMRTRKHRCEWVDTRGHMQLWKKVSDKLQTVTDLDIAELVTDVKSAAQPYQACKGRIDAATKELETAFTQVNELNQVVDNLGKEVPEGGSS